MLIPDKIIEEIRSRCDIADIISEYVPLTSAGKNYKGLCPFHEEKTPSFTVSRERQVFKCFGCNEAGDVFTFLMKHQKMSYPEAIKTLAARCGVVIPEEDKDGKTSNLDRDRLYNLNRFAVDYYHKLLINSPAGKVAMSYLKNRGIEDNTISSFKLGFSLPSWDDFLNAAKRAGFPAETILQGGFILQSKKQSYYDRFRGRIMFPIFDTRGEPIAFGGRILDDTSSEAKYMNSPETPLYIKSRSLYNLNLANVAIQKEKYAILVEGYMDVISCFQAGVHNIIASLGTSLSEGHVRLIKKYTEEVIIAYDSDKAGEAATLRGLDLLIKGDLKVRILTIPSGKDPDDFIRTEGVDSFKKYVSKADNLIDYKLNRVNEQSDINSIDGKKKAISALVTTLASMNNEFEKSEYVRKCAEKLGIEEEYVWQELRNIGAARNIQRSSKPVIKASTNLSVKESIERKLVECLIQYPHFINRAKYYLNKDDFSNRHAELIKKLWNRNGSTEEALDLPGLINECESKESRDILSSLILRKTPIPNEESTFNGCIKKMMDFRLDESRRNISKEDTGDSLAKARQLMELRKKKSSFTDTK